VADDPHAVAILDLLYADTVLTVCDGQVDTGIEKPYVVVYFFVQPQRGDDLTGMSRERKTRAIIHCVGETAAASRILAQRVEDALLDKEPVIPGWITWPIEGEYGQPPLRDEYTGYTTQDAIRNYVLKSKRNI
jgi:hypothetical protein